MSAAVKAVNVAINEIVWRGYANITRGTLQPLPVTEEPLDTVRCAACGAHFVPDSSMFGCPGCETQRDLDALRIAGT